MKQDEGTDDGSYYTETCTDDTQSKQSFIDLKQNAMGSAMFGGANAMLVMGDAHFSKSDNQLQSNQF